MPDLPTTQFTRFCLSVLLLFPLAVSAQSENWYRVELLVFAHPAAGASEQWEPTPDLAYPDTSRFLVYPGEQSVSAEKQATEAGLPDTTTGSRVDAAAIALPAAQSAAFATLPPTQREFSAQAAQMQRSGRYRILFHEAWMQPLSSQSAAQPIVLDRSGDGGAWPTLQGSIKLYMSSEIYLETNLWLNTPGDYLPGSWRMPPPPLGPASTAQSRSLSAGLPPGSDQETSDAVYPFRHAVLLNQTRRMRSGQIVYIDHPMLGVVVKVSVPEDVAADKMSAQ